MRKVSITELWVVILMVAFDFVILHWLSIHQAGTMTVSDHLDQFESLRG